MGGATSRSGMYKTCSISPPCISNFGSRETIKRLLSFPADTNIIWKSHDDSIAQRSAIDQARHDKTSTGTGHQERRRTGQDDSDKAKPAVAL